MNADYTNIILAIGCILIIYLVTKRWAWILLFGIGALASVFALLASIIHFQILGAVGFFFLAALLASITAALSE